MPAANRHAKHTPAERLIRLIRLLRLLRHRLLRHRLLRRRAPHLRLGRRGETLACRALTELGLEILCRNYRNPRGEIDIVAREDTVLCFIEVKTRTAGPDAHPADAVDRTRRKRYIRAAARYMQSICPDARLVHRYDIVELEMTGRRPRTIRYWRDAFREDENR